MRKAYRWVRSRPKTTVLLVVLTFVVALNVLAYRHAYAMTHFVATEEPAKHDVKWTESSSFGDRAALVFNGVTLSAPRNERAPRGVGLAFSVQDAPGDLGKLEAWYVPHEQPR